MRLSNCIIFLLFLGSCISPYFNDSQYQEVIVVDGMITDQPGPYEVSISKSIILNNEDVVYPSSPISKAQVILQDDLGNVENLVEKSSGHYYTTSLQGVVGRSYYLVITTQDGSVYKSSQEKLLPVGDFVLNYELQIEEAPQLKPNRPSKNGFKIYIDSEVLPEQENRVWWRYTGTYKIITYPMYRVDVQNSAGGAPPVVTPDPTQCSGYIYRNRSLTGPLFPCTCCTCWVSQYSQLPLISDPNFISNGMIKNQYIGFIEVNVRTFYEKYYLQIDQLSVSQTVYDFWKNIKIVSGNSENLFQTPAPKTKGNITALSAKSRPVIGYFAASAVKSHAIALDQTNLPTSFLPPIDTITEDCRLSFRYSTTTKPLFW